LEITLKRREIQQKFNKEHHITPQTVKRAPVETLEETFGMTAEEEKESNVKQFYINEDLSAKELEKKIKDTELEMKKAAKELRFEDAANLRDHLRHYQSLEIIS
jgi:excinuclease ABC subunit B